MKLFIYLPSFLLLIAAPFSTLAETPGPEATPATMATPDPNKPVVSAGRVVEVGANGETVSIIIGKNKTPKVFQVDSGTRIQKSNRAPGTVDDLKPGENVRVTSPPASPDKASLITVRENKTKKDEKPKDAADKDSAKNSAAVPKESPAPAE